MFSKIYYPHHTVESVTEGHPDKVCDQIADALLDEFLRKDPNSRTAVEILGSHGRLFIGGEVTSKASEVEVAQTAQRVYRQIGYSEPLEVVVRIERQSPDIAQGVDTGGAGDQGIMYGYACDETKELMPLAVVLAHGLTSGLAELRRKDNEAKKMLGPDGKAQVSFEKGQLTTLLVSTQHAENIAAADLKNFLIQKLIRPLLEKFGLKEPEQILVNPTGRFVLGGFSADSGLTGRKIMVDTYGGLAPHGGGAFSGKDPTKVDRSAAYIARHAAKSIVASGLAKECLVSVAYAIGKAEPLMLHAETFNEKSELATKLLNEKFDFRPKAIIEYLDLRKPIYLPTASYGHFGRPEFSWEKTKEL
ncbi:MAG: methionine adenosyltransferase [Patescibacteria group bacterium]|mgnify:CR=1 FL=1